MQRHDKYHIMAAARDRAADVRRLWEHVPMGLALSAKFYSDDPWITAGELAEGLDDSEDTVRRRLDRLAAIGRVKVAKRGRFTVYKAHRDWAEKTYQTVNQFLLDAKCVHHFH